jgi:two-component system phosphate regulon sensor histidine kinase PhoR
MLDSMQEAVVAITPEGLVRWSNATMERIAGTQIRVGRPLIQSVRDPELLACVKGALEQHRVHTGRASTLAPGRIFEIHAAPMPSGGALAVLHDVTRIEAAEKSRRATNCAPRLHPSRVMRKLCSKIPIQTRKPAVSFSASSTRTPPA